MCELFLDLGADVSIQTNVGKPTIMLGLQNGCYAQKCGRDFIYQSEVIVETDTLPADLLERIINLSPDSLKIASVYKDTSLHALARNFTDHKIRTMEAILKHCTTDMVNQQGFFGSTPMLLVLNFVRDTTIDNADIKKFDFLVKGLFRKGARLDIADIAGTTYANLYIFS